MWLLARLTMSTLPAISVFTNSGRARKLKFFGSLSVLSVKGHSRFTRNTSAASATGFTSLKP